MEPAPAPTFRELAYFQAVEVPVLLGGVAVDPADRNAPLVVDRAAILRAELSVPDGWTPADLELAVDLTMGSKSETFSVTIHAQDDAPGVVEIPANAMTTDGTYVVRLADGDQTLARFPEAGEAPLAAMVTGPLALRLVPFEANGFVPDTSSAVVEGYRTALMATYPVTAVSITVGDVQSWAGPVDLGAINVRVGELQEQAMVAGEVGWNVYYYGMVSGVASRDEFMGITGTSESGGDGELVRAYFAAGAAFGDQKSEDTLIHEIGHTHRLLHTPCDGEDDPDPAYPYAGGTIGVEGYDFRTGTFIPADTADLMAYCFPRWISDYSYTKLAAHVASAQSYAGFE